jgi:hypothetical protein
VVGLSSEDLTKLQSRAEGWAAGLRLVEGSTRKVVGADLRSGVFKLVTALWLPISFSGPTWL